MTLEWPITFGTKQAKKDWDDRMRRSVVADGRASRAVGISIDACPPYRDPDMAIDWRNGWRWEDEARAARTELMKGYKR